MVYPGLLSEKKKLGEGGESARGPKNRITGKISLSGVAGKL